MVAKLDLLLTSHRPFLTDGGLETDLIFNDGCELPLFSAFVLLETAEGKALLRRYFDRYLDIAETSGRGFLLDTPTWRANAGWAAAHGLDARNLKRINAEAVQLARDIRSSRTWADRILISGNIGPAGDGYSVERGLESAAAQDLHMLQMEAFAEEGVDLAIALTMTHVGEAIGVARAGEALGVPVVISFTVETDGNLPDGSGLREAIAAVEEATQGTPLFYGINCAHPTHFMDKLSGAWTERVGLVRANASTLSHAELDAATELDDGDPQDFGRLYKNLSVQLPRLRVVGGCCGSDCRHVAAVANPA